MPVPGGDSRKPDPERTTILPVLNPVRPGEPDQDRTTIMPRLVRNVAAPSDLEQTRPLSRLNGEAAADAGQTERRDPVGEESTEAMR